MAFTSLASGVHGLGTQQPIFSARNEQCCSKKRGAPATASILPSAPKNPLHHHQFGSHTQICIRKESLMPCRALNADDQSLGDDSSEDSSSDKDSYDANGDFRKRLENIIGDDDSNFSGKDLAMLIRKKYGRSYDVQLIKKEFMGRQLLAMNVMWKYREQRSFPLTEEQYLLGLDDVANNLRCWGAVSYVRNSLAKTKERPRIGKAVSIFIDLDESGGRANEWIYR